MHFLKLSTPALVAAISTIGAVFNFSTFTKTNTSELWQLAPLRDQSLLSIAKTNHEKWVQTSMVLYLVLHKALAGRIVYVDQTSPLPPRILGTCCNLNAEWLPENQRLRVSQPTSEALYAESHSINGDTPVELLLYREHAPVFILSSDDRIVITDAVEQNPE